MVAAKTLVHHRGASQLHDMNAREWPWHDAQDDGDAGSAAATHDAGAHDTGAPSTGRPYDDPNYHPPPSSTADPAAAATEGDPSATPAETVPEAQPLIVEATDAPHSHIAETTGSPQPTISDPASSERPTPTERPSHHRHATELASSTRPAAETEASSASSSSSGAPVGAIVGGVLAALALAAAACALFWFLRRRRRRYAPLKRVAREDRPVMRPFAVDAALAPGASGGVQKSMTDTVLVPTERSAGFAGAPRARDSMDLSQLSQQHLHEMAQRTQIADMSGMPDHTPGPSGTTGSGSSERRYDPPAYASWTPK